MLSIVLPAHNEAPVLPQLLERLENVLSPITEGYEVICVDDGSTDGTWDVLCRAAEASPHVRAIRLSRNFGHQIALTAGLTMAQGDGVVTMDSDLQHPPELIPALLAKAREGADVVVAVRRFPDGEGWFKNSSARFFYWLLNRLTGLDLPHGGADFRFMSRQVVDAMLAMPERHRFLRGMTRWLGFRQALIEYDRAPRGAGRSKYTVSEMIRFAFDAIVGYSAAPLKLASVLGFIVSALGALYAVYIVGVKLFSDSAVPGWSSVAVAVLVLGGVQLACLGIIGQYLGRLYEQSKGRPLFVIWEDTGHPHAAAPEPGVRRFPAEPLVSERRD